MPKVNNDAVSLDIRVELSWYMLGQQFSELNHDEQANFLVGMITVWDEFATGAMLRQMDEVVDLIDKRRHDQKPRLAKFFRDFADRLES